jgi:transcription initiation factor TFIIB
MSSSVLVHADRLCSECGSHQLISDYEAGEHICCECGYVISDTFIDRKPEWRAFNLQEKATKSRVGLPASLAVSDKGLHTNLGNVYRDINGNVSSERKWQLLRLSKWQRRVTGSKNQRNLSIAMGILATLVSHLKIMRPVQEQAALFYRKALQKDLVKGRSIENMVSACLYAACRITGTQRTLKEITVHTSDDKIHVAKTYRLIYKELNLKIPRPNAINRIPKIASKVRVPQKTQNNAIKILRIAEIQKITIGKDPNGLAAAALYIACIQDNAKIPQKQIAYAAGVTDVTVRNRYKEIVNKLEIQL